MNASLSSCSRALLCALLLSPLLSAGALTRSGALQAALASPPVAVAQSRLAVARAQAQAGRIPLSASASAGYALASEAPGSFNAGINLNIGGLFGEGAAARARTERTFERLQAGVLTAQLQAQGRALRGWHTLRRAALALGVSRLAQDLAALEDRQAELRLEAGGINVGERESVRRRLEAAQLDGSRAGFALGSAREALALDLERAPEPASGDWTPLAVPGASPEGRLPSREEVREARFAVAEADEALTEARRRLWPTASLSLGANNALGSVQFGLSDTLASSLSVTPALGSSPARAPSWTLGLGLSYTFSPAAIAGLGALETARREAAGALERTRRAALIELRSLGRDLESAHIALRLAEEGLRLAQAALERTQIRLESGQVSALDLRRAALERQRAALSVFEAQASLDSATLTLYTALALALPLPLGPL